MPTHCSRGCYPAHCWHCSHALNYLPTPRGGGRWPIIPLHLGLEGDRNPNLSGHCQTQGRMAPMSGARCMHAGAIAAPLRSRTPPVAHGALRTTPCATSSGLLVSMFGTAPYAPRPLPILRWLVGRLGGSVGPYAPLGKPWALCASWWIALHSPCDKATGVKSRDIVREKQSTQVLGKRTPPLPPCWPCENMLNVLCLVLMPWQ